MSAQAVTTIKIEPDRIPLTATQAQRLSGLTHIEASQLEGRTVAEISDKFRWQIDPNYLLFKRVCGQVVKKNPSTGVNEPVPFATVYAEDTVCSLLGHFPIHLPWVWFFPIHCNTEVVAKTVTDACGKFCVWVLRFEIEWILRFRLERKCYLELFRKPTIGAILQYLQGNPAGPDPDPDTITLKAGSTLYQKAEQLLGSTVTRKLALLGDNKAFGSKNSQKALLESPAFPAPLAPALPKEFRTLANGQSKEEHEGAVRSTLANKLGLASDVFANLNLGRYFGPFLRCREVLMAEWVPFFEVPDLSFRVTQDVNSNGTQETIYSGGLFDVAWGTGDIPDVTLQASAIAVSTTSCLVPVVPCGNVPSLEFVGLMPLVNPPVSSPPVLPDDLPYVDTVAGYATRPNRPHPGGTIGEPGMGNATAPYTGTLQLYGCNEVDEASFYRLRYTYTAPGSTTASVLLPFKGLSWPLQREVAGVLETIHPMADSNGWYPVIPSAEGWFPNQLMLEWDTTQYADGLYTVQLEVTDATKTVVNLPSSPVGFMVDNSAPAVTVNAIWSKSADMSDPQPLPTNDCVVIYRGTPNVAIYVQVTWSVVANHLRSVQAGAGGCGGGATLTAGSATGEYWYKSALDNSFSSVETYQILATATAGVYTFNLNASSRAFNPAGSDAGPLDNWIYNPIFVYTDPTFAIAIADGVAP